MLLYLLSNRIQLDSGRKRMDLFELNFTMVLGPTKSVNIRNLISCVTRKRIRSSVSSVY